MNPRLSFGSLIKWFLALKLAVMTAGFAAWVAYLLLILFAFLAIAILVGCWLCFSLVVIGEMIQWL